MKGFLIIFAIISVAAASVLKPGLRVKFDFGLLPSLGASYFYDIPRYVSDAEDVSWVETEGPAGPLADLVMYCYKDRMICSRYDDTGYIAGLQVAIPVSQYSNGEFDWETQGWTEWNTTIHNVTTQFWAISQYYVDEDFLATSKAERLASRNSSMTLQAGAIWLTGINGVLDKISILQEDITDTVFTEQVCVPWMGTHYYYNMSSSTECTADKIYPWFLFFKNGYMDGSGLMNFGKLTLTRDQRNWFENPGEFAVRVFVPRAPDCLYSLASSPGFLTMHIYYVDKPWTVYC